ncbi:hypothetical protein EVB91_167 [Rhizobium phage RHph_I1_18]|nr:hypothetical protein EVB91_167 [Rhizobium phage RHph_I1_18]
MSTRYLITQYDSNRTFYAHTIVDLETMPAVVRSNGRLFALDVKSISTLQISPEIVECYYDEIVDSEIVEL